MRQLNGKLEEAKDLQNRFTGYLLRAIQREKRDYENKQNRLAAHEIQSDFSDITLPAPKITDLSDQLPLLMCIENPELLKAIESLDDAEQRILFARILEECSYDELGQKLGLQYKGASAAYYRVIHKLRKNLRGDEH